MAQEVPDFSGVDTSELDAGSAITTSLMTRMEANPRAMMGGGGNAPRLLLPAIYSEISAGDTLRWSVNSPGGTTCQFNLFHGGSVRVAFRYSINGSGNLSCTLTQNGTTVYSGSGSTASVDLEIEPGDLFMLSGSVSGDEGSAVLSYVRLLTGGEHIFPAGFNLGTFNV